MRLSTFRPALASTLALCAFLAGPPAMAQSAGASSGAALPAAVEAALARARIPRDAVTLVVADAQGGQGPRLAHRADAPVNPASVMKLVTTYAALDLLGPAFAWHTPVYVDGPVQSGTLRGNLYIRGQGDPKLVAERLWLLMRRVRGLGIDTIAGDIVLDRAAFETAPQDPGAFDGEPLRPYNAVPDALLVNFKSLVMSFTPDRAAGVARVQVEPPLAGLDVAATVPLSPATGPRAASAASPAAAPAAAFSASADCGDWRGALRADFSDAARVRFAGAYPAGCGERVWPVAAADPAGYAARAVDGMWRQVGGRLTGRVREGAVPPSLAPSLESVSPPLAEVVRDINKYSNNVMAQQVFLTLSLQQRGVGTFAGSRELLARWWRERLGEGAPAVENGAGLARDDRITAASLARLLQLAWASPLMPELAASLPVFGVDGTLRRGRGAAPGVAHLKTGSLRDVAGVAGYVHGASGRRYVLVAIANHPNAAAARPAFEALVDWTARDR